MTEDLQQQLATMRERLASLHTQVLDAKDAYDAAAEGHRDVIAQLARRFRAIEVALRDDNVRLALTIASEQAAHLERGDSAPTRTRM